MKPVRFVLDSGDMNPGSVPLSDAFSPVLARMQIAFDREETVAYSDDFEPTLGSLWSATDRNFLEDLTVAFASVGSTGGPLVRWDAEELPDADEVHVDGGPETNLDVAWVHQKNRSGHAVALLGMQRSGSKKVTSAGTEQELHWVATDAQHRDFFRAAFDVEGDGEATFATLAPHAFPDLFFLPGVFTELKNFEGGYQRARVSLRKDLATFNDGANTAFAPGWTNQSLQNAYTLNLAPETAETAKDRTCRTARERILDGMTLYCEWHIKLERHINRVHVHPPVPASCNRPVVAIFHAHLPLVGG